MWNSMNDMVALSNQPDNYQNVVQMLLISWPLMDFCKTLSKSAIWTAGAQETWCKSTKLEVSLLRDVLFQWRKWWKITELYEIVI